MSKHSKSLSVAVPAHREARRALSDRAKRLSAHLLDKHKVALKHTHALDALAAADGHINRQAAARALEIAYEADSVSLDDLIVTSPISTMRTYDLDALLEAMKRNPTDPDSYRPFLPCSTVFYADFVQDLAARIDGEEMARIALICTRDLTTYIAQCKTFVEAYKTIMTGVVLDPVYNKIRSIGLEPMIYSFQEPAAADINAHPASEPEISAGPYEIGHWPLALAISRLSDQWETLYGDDEIGEPDSFIDARGVEMPPMTYRAALSQLHRITDRQRRIDLSKEEHQAVREVVELMLGGHFDDLPTPTEAKVFPQAYFALPETSRPNINPLRIFLELSQRFARRPEDVARGIVEADEMDVEQQAIDILRNLIGELVELN